MKASHRRRSLLLFVYSDSYYGRARAEVRTNQMGYITVIARVARDLWQRKQTLSSGFALGLGSFTAINPWHPCNNYYVTLEYQGLPPEDCTYRGHGTVVVNACVVLICWIKAELFASCFTRGSLGSLCSLKRITITMDSQPLCIYFKDR